MEDESKDKLKIIKKYKENQKYVFDQLEAQQDINCQYNPIYNQLPSLQNKYAVSSFFPKDQWYNFNLKSLMSEFNITSEEQLDTLTQS